MGEAAFEEAFEVDEADLPPPRAEDDGKRGSILRAPSLTRKSTKTAGEITRSLDDEVKV